MTLSHRMKVAASSLFGDLLRPFPEKVIFLKLSIAIGSFHNSMMQT